MRKPLFLNLLIALIVVFNIDAEAQVPDSVRMYIDSAISFMQTQALNAKELDWEKIKASAKAGNAKSKKEAFPAVQYAFEQLKDYHGMVANPDTFYRYPPRVNFSEVLSPGLKKEFLKGNRIVTAILNTNIAYLRLPGMHVLEQKAVDEKQACLSGYAGAARCIC